VKIRLGLCIQETRGACIDEIEDFDDVLLLALGIGLHTGDVFEIHLDFFKWLGTLDGFALAMSHLGNALVAAQNVPYGRCGTG
jgi:hypothetical protein